MQRLIIVFLLLSSGTAYGQWFYNFDAPVPNNFMFGYIVDSSQVGNIWQVGRPQKTVFNAAYSQPNALLTDTINTYPAHDTSSFTLYHARDFLLNVLSMRLQFYYKLDKDPQASAKLEMSGDRGASWIDVLVEDSTYHLHWLSPKPRLDTSVHTWTYVDMKLDDWLSSRYSLAYPHNFTADSILFRFTFSSGSIVVPHDGWMIDNLGIVDSGTGDHVPDVRYDDLVKVYPNPSKGVFCLTDNANKEGAMIAVYDIRGIKVYEQHDLKAKSTVDLPLLPGAYLLRYSIGGKYAMKRIMIAQ